MDSGTLSGVTFDGPLNLTSTRVSTICSARQRNDRRRLVRLGAGHDQRHGCTIRYLYFDNTQTVSNDDDQSRQYERLLRHLSEDDTAGAGNQVLTLASSVTVDVQGDASIQSSGYSGDGIVNDGAIDVTGSAGISHIDPQRLHQQAARSTSRTATSVSSSRRPSRRRRRASLRSGRIRRSRSIRPTPGPISARSRWRAARAFFSTGSMSAASLGSITNSGGTVYIGGTWNNSGQTLNGSASFGSSPFTAVRSAAALSLRPASLQIRAAR